MLEVFSKVRVVKQQDKIWSVCSDFKGFCLHHQETVGKKLGATMVKWRWP